PPGWPRSLLCPFAHRNGWAVWSPARSLPPTTSPRLFSQLAKPIVPPRVPRSRMCPLAHKNGSSVGMLVAGLGVELVHDCPVICPRAFCVVLTASGPPSVPMSRITPLRQANERAWVPHPEGPHGPGPPNTLKNEYLSWIPLEANPDTCPRSLMSLAWLSYPPRGVPGPVPCPPVNMTAGPAAQPVCGSVMAVSDMPPPTPLPLPSKTALLLLPGSPPRSRRCPPRHSNACV